MSSIATLIHDEALASTLQKGLYALGACTIIGTAAYIGYKAAGPSNRHVPHNRHPESNEQVSKYILHDLKIRFLVLRVVIQGQVSADYVGDEILTSVGIFAL